MALTLLPNEILVSIVEHVIPEGFESLALTCQKFNSLCGPFLSQHNIRRARFYNFRYYTEWYTEPFQVRSAFDLIALIAVEPIIARYVINADFSRDSWLTNGRPRAFNPDVRPEDFRIDAKLDCSGSIHNLLAASPYLTAAGLDWKQYWMTIDTDLENIEYRGYSQHASTFLLTLLPNTKTITLPQRWRTLDESDKLISAIVGKARQPHLSSGKPSLAQVTSIRTPCSMDLCLATPFFALPSVRSFYGPSCVTPSSVASSYFPNREHTTINRKSYNSGFKPKAETMEIVHLSEGCIDAADITAFLTHTPRLRSLRYSHRTREETHEGWDVCGFVNAIGHAVGPSLEELSVSIHKLRSSIAPGTINMRDFQRLQKLEFSLELAVCNLASSEPSVADSMKDLSLDDAKSNLLAALVPPTVTQLSIKSPSIDAHVPALEKMFQGFAAKKAQIVPQLNELHLSCLVSPGASDKYKEVCEMVREECLRGGVTCTLKEWKSNPTLTWAGEE